MVLSCQNLQIGGMSAKIYIYSNQCHCPSITIRCVMKQSINQLIGSNTGISFSPQPQGARRALADRELLEPCCEDCVFPVSNGLVQKASKWYYSYVGLQYFSRYRSQPPYMSLCNRLLEIFLKVQTAVNQRGW